MNIRTYFSGPVKLLTLFVLLAGVPLAALGWLGWRLLDQDRTLEKQRERDRLDSAAALLGLSLATITMLTILAGIYLFMHFGWLTALLYAILSLIIASIFEASYEAFETSAI